jgi:hypothetical protein
MRKTGTTLWVSLVALCTVTACSDDVTTTGAAGSGTMSSSSNVGVGGGGGAAVTATATGSGSGGASSTSMSSVVASSASTTTVSSTGGGTNKCEQACAEIHTCGLATSGGKPLCPGFSATPAGKTAFMTFCIAECESISDFVFFVIPEDCPATIGSFNALGASYAAVCKMGPT